MAIALFFSPLTFNGSPPSSPPFTTTSTSNVIFIAGQTSRRTAPKPWPNGVNLWLEIDSNPIFRDRSVLV